ncbi:MAG: carotenoid biosynthesis protein [Rubrobacteraceae bacterium]
MTYRDQRRLPTLLLAVSAIFFGVSYFTVRFPDVPGASVASYAATVAIALPAFVALFRYLGVGRGALALLVLSVFGYGIEGLGVATGFPYGTFYYGEALGPKLLGLAPYILPVSYVPLVIGAVAATGSRSLVAWVLKSALLLTLMDGVLDPGAASLGFWIWPDGGPYYGVPVSNYLGWIFSGALASGLLLAAGRWNAAPLPGLLDSSIIAIAFWTGISVFSLLPIPALLGAVLFVYLLRRRSHLRRRISHTTGRAGGYKLGAGF